MAPCARYAELIIRDGKTPKGRDVGPGNGRKHHYTVLEKQLLLMEIEEVQRDNLNPKRRHNPEPV